MEFKSGDVVKITTKNEAGEQHTHEGILLQRPQLLKPGYTILKLKTGYNIGIKTSTIISQEVIKAYTPQKVEQVVPKTNPSLPTVAVVSFGGTIASRVDYKTGGVVADYGASDFYAMIPELATIANIKAHHVANVMSEDMDQSHWLLIAKSIEPFLNDKTIAGVVVTHGTDTMHYSSAAVSFLIDNLNKPVVFTGSQRSIDRGSSDAFLNLLCAVKIAAAFDGAVVGICMHENSNDDSCLFIRGTNVRKMHTSRRDAFRPINEQALARISANGEITVINNMYLKRTTDEKVTIQSSMESKVGLVYIHPGMQPSVIEYYINNKYKGLIVAATALGHIPHTLLTVFEKAVASGMLICVASQTIYGRTHPSVYSRLREQSIKLRMSFLENMLIETAFTKLSWALAFDEKNAEQVMLENMRGEIIAEIDEKSFLN